MDWQEQLITIYLYVCKHYRETLWSYCQRMSNNADLSFQTWLIDSFPVALAKQGHRFNAKMAPELANTGYYATKKLYFYGIRVHVLGRAQSGTLPRPEYIGITAASCNDGKVFEQIRPFLHNNELYGDKAYKLPDEELF